MWRRICSSHLKALAIHSSRSVTHSSAAATRSLASSSRSLLAARLFSTDSGNSLLRSSFPCWLSYARFRDWFGFDFCMWWHCVCVYMPDWCRFHFGLFVEDNECERLMLIWLLVWLYQALLWRRLRMLCLLQLDTSEKSLNQNFRWFSLISS